MKKINQEERKLTHFITTLTHNIGKYLNKNKRYSSLKNNDKEWDFVPSTNYYLKSVKNILIKEKIKQSDNIIDLGCGISPVLIYLRYMYYFNLFGIDNDIRYIELLRKIIYQRDPSDNFLVGNLNRLTPKQRKLISKCKVIYLYMPIADYKKFNKLLIKISKLMQKDSILISFYGNNNYIKGLKFIELDEKDRFSSLGYFKKI